MFLFKLALVGCVFASGYFIGRFRRMGLENTGEGAIRDLLTRQFPGEEFHLMNNLTLPCSDGTTQIDHVLLSRYGVFVIETKHYTGWIFANADSAKWTQVIYQVRNQFQNPIRQNFKHVQIVRRLLDFVPNEHIHSLVVFTGDAEFKTPKPDGVFSPLGLVSHLHGFAEEVLTVDQLHTAVGRLECARRLISGKTDTEHQRYLNQRFGEL